MAGILTVDVSQVAIITLRGEVDLAGLGDLQGAIETFLAPGQTVVLDLSEVTREIDGALDASVRR